MKRAVLVLAFAAALCACATQRDGKTAPAPVVPPPASGLDWIFHAEEDNAELMFGTPESDDLHLGLECRGGGDPVIGLTRVAPEGAPAEIVLQAGGKTQRYAANSEPDDLGGGVILTSRLARKTDPVVQGLKDTGWLTVLQDGRPEHLIPQHNTTAVADFFQWCGP